MIAWLDALSSRFWQSVDAPIHWIEGGPIDPVIERPLEYLELIFLVLVIATVFIIAWDVARSHARQRRNLQNQWQQRLRERKRRLKLTSRSLRDGRLGSSQ